MVDSEERMIYHSRLLSHILATKILLPLLFVFLNPIQNPLFCRFLFSSFNVVDVISSRDRTLYHQKLYVNGKYYRIMTTPILSNKVPIDRTHNSIHNVESCSDTSSRCEVISSGTGFEVLFDAFNWNWDCTTASANTGQLNTTASIISTKPTKPITASTPTKVTTGKMKSDKSNANEASDTQSLPSIDDSFKQMIVECTSETSSSSSSSQEQVLEQQNENDSNNENERLPNLIEYTSESDVDSNADDKSNNNDEERNRQIQKQQQEQNDVTTIDNLSKRQKLSYQWSMFIVNKCHKPILRFEHKLADYSAKNPWRTILFISILSISLFTIGLFTNFTKNVSETDLWTPSGSTALHYTKWYSKESTFPKDNSSGFLLLLHANGKSVLTKNAVRMVFNATETLMKLPEYVDVCSSAGAVYITLPNATRIRTCPVTGLMRFWNYSSLLYDWTSGTDEMVRTTVSKRYYPDGNRVIDYQVFGKPVRDPNTQLLKSVKSYPWVIYFPITIKSKQNEQLFINTILQLNDVWKQNPATSRYEVTVIAQSSFSNEFTRGILVDIPLVPFVIILMAAFSCVYFYRHHKVLSRSALGLAAVVAISASMLTGYGLMFICGVSFTSMTQLIPFIIFGIGLDDAFILVDTYERTNDNNKDPVERIHDTISECGVSITMTTITSVLAFASGLTSTIPAVNWLCMYATVSIALVLLYQLTFFVSCIVLDERRIKANRRDCCLCIKVKTNDDDNDVEQEVTEKDKDIDTTTVEKKQSLLDKYTTYGWTKMLQPRVKVCIVILFVTYLVLAANSTSKLKQSFTFSDVLPKDSYVLDSVNALNMYRENSAIPATIIFRNVDFSDTIIQQQMEQYIIDLVNMKKYVSTAPQSFWLRDFKQFIQNTTYTIVTTKGGTSTSTTTTSTTSNTTADTVIVVGKLSFRKQIQAFLNTTEYGTLYKPQMGFNKNGLLVETSCLLEMDLVDFSDIKSQIGVLKETYRVSSTQPVNAGLDEKDYKFFTYSNQFRSFSFFSICVQELISNTIMGIVSVTIVTIFMIPHWSAALYILPLMCMMYIDILGMLNWGGVKINPVSFVSIIMSIGLIVDYQMHVLLRYVETPGSTSTNKTISTLRTIGISVFGGGFSTFLGTVPLVLSKTTIFWTVFISFMSLVTVAIAHGLILLPILLSTFGAVKYVIPPKPTLREQQVQQLQQQKGANSTEQPLDDEVPMVKFSF